MDGKATAVVDTNVLLNLATPVVDARPTVPSGGDPFKTLLSTYDVHVPAAVLAEVGAATASDDLLSAAADTVLAGSESLTEHAVPEELEDALDYGLDDGESRAIWLANDLGAELFLTDEFNTSNYLLVAEALDDRESLFTTPQVLCTLAKHEYLDDRYVSALLTYYVETKGWDGVFVDQLRTKYLDP
jgi:hypothetical protein